MKTFLHRFRIPGLPGATRVAAVLLTLVLTGCVQTYTFKVDALRGATTPPSAASYRLASGDDKIPPSDLLFQEAAGYVRNALSGLGYYAAPNPAEADLVIQVEYGVSDPKTSYRQTWDPVIGEIGPRYTYVSRRVRTGDGHWTYITVPVYIGPRFDVIGHIERTVPETVYEKFLIITAYDARAKAPDGAAVELWRVKASNLDSSDDLRRYLPLLTAAALPHLGQDTAGQKKVVLKEEDSDVTFVRTRP